MGATVLGALFGRKTFSASTLGRATTAARGVGRASKEQDDVKRAQENVDVARKALEELDAAIAEETGRHRRAVRCGGVGGRDHVGRAEARPGARAVGGAWLG